MSRLPSHLSTLKHFNMGTFAGREWATGYEDPDTFAPVKLDCGQWAGAAAAAGVKYAVLTAKHTGGWCLWPSAHTTHGVQSFRRFRGGRGDLVREYVDAFRSHGIKAGLYYCFPGDFVKPATAIPELKRDLHGLPPEAQGEYTGFMKKQLVELLTYRPDLLWIDQACTRDRNGRSLGYHSETAPGDWAGRYSKRRRACGQVSHLPGPQRELLPECATRPRRTYPCRICQTHGGVRPAGRVKRARTEDRRNPWPARIPEYSQGEESPQRARTRRRHDVSTPSSPRSVQRDKE
jgi:hypothetical protein